MLNWLLPKSIRNLLDVVRDWELEDVAKSLRLSSLMTAKLSGINQYRAAVDEGIAMFDSSANGQVPPSRWSRWGGGKHLGILGAPKASIVKRKTPPKRG
jgi:hypothetical protein